MKKIMTGEYPNDQVSCTVLIRAYNEEKHIGRLLTGISQQTVKNVEIILVDSGSTDATVAIAKRYPVEVVHVPAERFTFGYSLNCGIAYAQSEFVVIASAHVYPVYSDWLEKLLAPFVDSSVALTYGRQRGNAKCKFSEREIFNQWFPETSQSHQSHPFCNNANAAIRRSLWEKNNYDELLTGLEDIAWAHWAIEQGYKVAYVAEAEIIHVHNENPRAVYDRYRREAMAFKYLFPDEGFRLWDFFRLFSTNVISDFWHAARQHVLLTSIIGIIWFRFAQFWGTYQGYWHAGPLTEQLRQAFYYPRGLRSVAEMPPREAKPIDYGGIG